MTALAPDVAAEITLILIDLGRNEIETQAAFAAVQPIIARLVAEERGRCAKVAEGDANDVAGHRIAAAIRQGRD